MALKEELVIQMELGMGQTQLAQVSLSSETNTNAVTKGAMSNVNSPIKGLSCSSHHFSCCKGLCSFFPD